MKMKDMVLIFLAGLALHQTASITHKMPTGWGYLAGLVIGVEGTMPFFYLLLRRFGVAGPVIALAIAAFELAFLFVGLGVAFGWLIDTIFDIKRA